MFGVFRKSLGRGLTTLITTFLILGATSASLRADDRTADAFLDISSNRCASDLAAIGKTVVRTTQGQAWFARTLATIGRFLMGPLYTAGAVQPEDSETIKPDQLYFHLLPDRAKALRNRLNAQQVNEVFAELLLRLNNALEQSDLTVSHRGMVSEYKSLRFTMARADIRVDEIEKAVSIAWANFGKSLRETHPDIYELLNGTIASEKDWIVFGVGPTDFKAKLASKYSTDHTYESAEAVIQRNLKRLTDLVGSLPGRMESIERLHFATVSKNGKPSLSFELFEILRSAEDKEQLAFSLSKRFQPPGVMSPEENAIFQSAVLDLWELRSLLKDFTPPNQWDQEDFAAYDADKVSKVDQADRILTIDLKGVGARLSQELFLSVQDAMSREDVNVLDSLKISDTVTWLKSRLHMARTNLRNILGDRYVAEVWVGDEVMIYYKGDTSVTETAKVLGSDFRVVDLQVKRANKSNISVYAQSTLGQIGETASKVVESSLGQFEQPPRVAINMRMEPQSEGTGLVFEVHFLDTHEFNRAAVEKFMETQFPRLFAEKSGNFSIWMPRIRFETHFDSSGAVQAAPQPQGESFPVESTVRELLSITP